jgi:hypothetical protein
MTVAGGASEPEGAGWYLMVFLLTPFGWFFLVPALGTGAPRTAVLVRQKT